MRVKKEITFLAVISAVAFIILANNSISGKLFKTKKQKVSHITRKFDKRFFRTETPFGSYWIGLSEKISTKYKTPIVVLLHGGVFKNIDYGKVFLKGIFARVIKNKNVIFALPVMPVSSHPVWRVKDYELIESVVKDVIKKYRLNPESPVFFGGFSNGAEVALKLVFSSKIKTKGVFAFAGGIRLIKNRSLIKKSDRNLAVFLSCGKNDANWIGSTLYSYNYLKKNNFKNLTVKGYAGLEHWISREQALFFLDWIEKNS